ALASKRVLILGSGQLALVTAALALEHGIEVAGLVEVGDALRAEIGSVPVLYGVPIYLSHTVKEARRKVGEVESVVLVQVDAPPEPVAGTEREIACDTICWAVGLVPNVELLHLVGARLAFSSPRGGWVPRLSDVMQTSVTGVFAVGDCAGVRDGVGGGPDVAHEQGRVAGVAAAGGAAGH